MSTNNANANKRAAFVLVGQPAAIECGAGASAVRRGEQLLGPVGALRFRDIPNQGNLSHRPGDDTPQRYMDIVVIGTESDSGAQSTTNVNLWVSREGLYGADLSSDSGHTAFIDYRTSAPAYRKPADGKLDGYGSHFVAKFGEIASASPKPLTTGRSNVLAKPTRTDAGGSAT